MSTLTVVAPPEGPTGAHKFSPKQSPVPRAPSDEMSSLGKRKAEMAWAPGSGVPCYSFGTPEDMERNSKMLRTSLLFLELQANVHAAIQRKAKKDQAEKALSHEIAMRHPIQFPEQSEPAHAHISVSKEQVAAKSHEAEVVFEAIGRKGKAEPELPAPLSAEILRKAALELSAGAMGSIETCVRCWREKKMDGAEVLGTVRSFASGSATLKKLFAAEAPQQLSLGETASQEDLKALALLAGTA